MKALIILGWLWLCPFFPKERVNKSANASLSNTCPSIQKADAILGEWLDEQKTVRIRVYKKSERYHARIVWLKDGSVAKTGTQVLEDLQYTPQNSWQKGRLFYPRTDSWYDCRCTLHGPEVMNVRVYIGTPILGKTIAFTRVETTEASTK